MQAAVSTWIVEDLETLRILLQYRRIFEDSDCSKFDYDCVNLNAQSSSFSMAT